MIIDLALIVAGGDTPPAWTITDLDPDIVIAADGGAASARTLGLEPCVVVGDLDSASEATIDWARSVGARIVEHPTGKDNTDLELALMEAERSSATRVVIVGTSGGRTDHSLANWAASCAPRPFSVEVREPGGITHVVTDTTSFSGRPGARISLLPWGGPVAGVSTQGMRWELDDAVLSPFSALGISNEFVGLTASVSIESGVLLAVLPGDL